VPPQVHICENKIRNTYFLIFSLNPNGKKATFPRIGHRDYSAGLYLRLFCGVDNATTVAVNAAVVLESFANPCVRLSLPPSTNAEHKVERPQDCFFKSSVLPDWNQPQYTNLRKASLKIVPLN